MKLQGIHRFIFVEKSEEATPILANASFVFT